MQNLYGIYTLDPCTVHVEENNRDLLQSNNEIDIST